MHSPTSVIFLSILDVARTDRSLRQGTRERSKIVFQPRAAVFLARVTRPDQCARRCSSCPSPHSLVAEGEHIATECQIKRSRPHRTIPNSKMSRRLQWTHRGSFKSSPASFYTAHHIYMYQHSHSCLPILRFRDIFLHGFQILFVWHLDVI
jgi:hypothetical protein